ncbi:hypothetical protein [Elizabethkingia anophelis]|uniref:hypothetical protein n=1 Tax=Elizabethkingia anophelis TaxID=1117645 RepID=UPI0012B2AD46|nr:hypothetical protein [Elizabethkingia anophelis]QGN22521.1 hypothetical protein GJV56_07720 [Elizabethkingia anophelis]QNV09173.1 hypothetical protein EIY88_07700 [Elizabethkingia anophelis]UTF90929.1 hypothetical protein J2N93_07765 [Elizabethkingia anophelis]UTG01799.1 hypothetical protein J2O04_07770 [Elizabethkingia anophelis]UTG05549.1 hypothetical protein J2O03_07765 [Elizabethkingia anophelis]
MYRKTPSDPQADNDGFGGLRERLRELGASGKGLLRSYPLQFLTLMLVCMLGSGILAFTVMRTDAKRTLPELPKAPPIGTGATMPGIIDTYGALREVAALQDTIAYIIAKDTLDATDSIRLTQALGRFERIQRTIMNNKKSTP